MGSTLSSSARQLAQRVAPSAPVRKLKPLTPAEIDALNRLAEQEQARMRELPSMEELNAKDDTLDGLLNKLGGAIAGRDLSPDAPQASISGRPDMPPARPPQTLRAQHQPLRRPAPSADDQPGRLQSYVLREILEGRTAAAAEGKELDLEPYVRTFGADRTKLLTLMENACMPQVGKVATFGHQYAFARPPAWWLKGGLSGARYLSEPTDDLRRRLMGNPVGKAADGTPAEPTAMFGGGRSGGAGRGVGGTSGTQDSSEVVAAGVPGAAAEESGLAGSGGSPATGERGAGTGGGPQQR